MRWCSSTGAGAALRDEKTLAELETQLQTLQLEQARQTDPWELISTHPA